MVGSLAFQVPHDTSSEKRNPPIPDLAYLSAPTLAVSVIFFPSCKLLAVKIVARESEV